MVSGADVRLALQAGLWEALEDDSGRAAMRATCRDARDIADELQDSTVLPVGPANWGIAASIAAYHRKLGAVRSLHVRYSCGEADGARAAQFAEAYSAALNAALPVDSCTIMMTSDMQLGTSFTAALLARVVPRVERLDIALGSYRNLAQLLTLLQPCTHLRSLRLLPADDDDTRMCVWLDTYRSEGSSSVLEALCGLTRLHALSGPWMIMDGVLQHLCAALPSLTTLGFQRLRLGEASGACISRQLHTLAGWRHSAWDNARSQPASQPWHLLDSSAGRIVGVLKLQSSLPAVQQLESLVLDAADLTIGGEEAMPELVLPEGEEGMPALILPEGEEGMPALVLPEGEEGMPALILPEGEGLAALVAAVQRFAACAERWACKVAFHSYGLEVAQRLAQGSLASVKHAVVEVGEMMPTDAASCLRSLVAAAPSITTLAVSCYFCDHSRGALADMLEPLRRAACLHTLRLAEVRGATMRAGGTALWLAEAVRGLVRPDAEGECCSALKRMRLAGVEPGDQHACRLALADDGVDVSVDACTW